MMMVQMNVWDMKMKTNEIFITEPHLKQTNKRTPENKYKEEIIKKTEGAIGYNKAKEKGQGSEAEIANLKRVKEESEKEVGILLIIE
ncbi:hypothetical protein LguiA_024232 [Lonicera macranthoides]